MASSRSKEYIKNWQEKNKDRIKKYRKNGDLKKRFGISLDDYNKMLKAQEGLCAICLQPEKQRCYKTGVTYNLSVDHCHKIGTIRALLCNRCNRTLGMVNDDIELLEHMINYLKSFNA